MRAPSTSFWKAGWFKKWRGEKNFPASIHLTRKIKSGMRTGKRRADVLPALQERLLSIAALQYPDRYRPCGYRPDAYAQKACGRMDDCGEYYFARSGGLVADGQSADPRARKPLSVLGCESRLPGRHHHFGRWDPCTAVARIWRPCAQRQRRPHRRHGEACARLSWSTHRLYGWRSQLVRQSDAGNGVCVSVA